MSHHHYDDAIDSGETNKKIRKIEEKKKKLKEEKNMVHHYDDGPDVAATNKQIREKQKEIEKLEKEKEKMIKDEQIKNQEALELFQKLQQLKEIKNQTESEIIDTQKKLYKLCTHEKTMIKTHTVPGGYLNPREHVTEVFCVFCGVLVDRKVKYGGLETNKSSLW